METRRGGVLITDRVNPGRCTPAQNRRMAAAVRGTDRRPSGPARGGLVVEPKDQHEMCWNTEWSRVCQRSCIFDYAIIDRRAMAAPLREVASREAGHRMAAEEPAPPAIAGLLGGERSRHAGVVLGAVCEQLVHVILAPYLDSADQWWSERPSLVNWRNPTALDRAPCLPAPRLASCRLEFTRWCRWTRPLRHTGPWPRAGYAFAMSSSLDDRQGLSACATRHSPC
jgi:hypothetical protein